MEEIKKWKEKYGAIFRKKIEDTVIYFRQLTAEEWIKFQELEKKSEDESEMAVIRCCVLHPVEFLNTIKPNSLVWDNLYNSIKNVSIYDTSKILSETKRLRNERDGNIFKILMANIIARIPAYKLEDIQGKNIDQLLELAIFAESVPVSNSLVKEDIIKDPEEEQKRAMQEQMRGLTKGRKFDPSGRTQKKFQHPARQFHENALASSESLKEALAAHGVNVKPIGQVHNEKSNNGSFVDKIRSLNRELEKRK